MGNVEVAYTQIYSICIILSLQHNLVPRAAQSCSSVLITGLGKTLKDEADGHHHHLLLLESTYSTCHHNYNKIIKSDWLSTVPISAL